MTEESIGEGFRAQKTDFLLLKSYDPVENKVMNISTSRFISVTTSSGWPCYASALLNHNYLLYAG